MSMGRRSGQFVWWFGWWMLWSAQGLAQDEARDPTRADALETHHHRFLPGWNLATFPHGLDDSVFRARGLKIFEVQSGRAPVRPTKAEYRAAENIDDQKGYWVYTKEAVEFVTRGPVNEPLAPAELPEGWSFVSGSTATACWGAGLDRAVAWNASAQAYASIPVGQSFPEGPGFFVHMEKTGAPFRTPCEESAPSQDPRPPRAFSAAMRGDQVTLSWEAPLLFEDGASIPSGSGFRYRIFRNGEVLGTVEGDRRVFEDGPVAPDERVTYFVVATVQHPEGESAPSVPSEAIHVRRNAPFETRPGDFETPGVVARLGRAQASPAIVLVSAGDRTLAHAAFAADHEGDEVRYHRSEQAGAVGSFEPAQVLARPDSGWVVNEVAVAARAHRVLVSWIQKQTEDTEEPLSELWVRESHNEGQSFKPAQMIASSTSWKRGLDVGFDRLLQSHLVWGEAHKVYYLKNLEGSPENVFDVQKRAKNTDVVEQRRVYITDCQDEVSACGYCTDRPLERYSRALDPAPGSDEPMGPYWYRQEEAWVYNPSLEIDDHKISIAVFQDRLWDNQPVRNPNWRGALGPLVPPASPKPTDQGELSWCPEAHAHQKKEGFLEVWQPHRTRPKRTPLDENEVLRRRAEESQPERAHRYYHGEGKGRFYAYDGTVEHDKDWYYYLHDGRWHEEDQIKIAQRPLVAGAWSRATTQEVLKPVWPIERGLLEWTPVETQVEAGWRQDAWIGETYASWRILSLPPLPSHGRGPIVPRLTSGPDGLSLVYEARLSSTVTDPNPIYLAQAVDGHHFGSPQKIAMGHLPTPAQSSDGDLAILFYGADPAQIRVARALGEGLFETTAISQKTPRPIYQGSTESDPPTPLYTPTFIAHETLFVAAWLRADERHGPTWVTSRASKDDQAVKLSVDLPEEIVQGRTTALTVTAKNKYDMRVAAEGTVRVSTQGGGGGQSGIESETLRQSIPLGALDVESGGKQNASASGLGVASDEQKSTLAGGLDLESDEQKSTFAGGSDLESDERQSAFAGGLDPQSSVGSDKGLAGVVDLELDQGQATLWTPFYDSSVALAVTSLDPKGPGGATLVASTISGDASGNYGRAKAARDRLLRPESVGNDGEGLLQIEYEGDPENADAPDEQIFREEEYQDARHLAGFKRAWAYTQGIALAQFSRSTDPTDIARAQGLARSLCAHAVVGHDDTILGWPFSWNTDGDNWKDARLVTGANAWALHGLGQFLVSGAYQRLEAKEQPGLLSCYHRSLRGLKDHRRAVQDVEGKVHTLMTAGWTTKGLRNAGAPHTLEADGQPLTTDPEEEWRYYSILDAIGYDDFPEDRVPTVERCRRSGATCVSMEAHTLTASEHRVLQERVAATNIVTEHNLDVLSVLNHAIIHVHTLQIDEPEALIAWRDELQAGIFTLLWDDLGEKEDLRAALGHSGVDPQKRWRIEAALESENLGRVITGGTLLPGEQAHAFAASRHVAIDNCSWLSLSVNYDDPAFSPAFEDKLARCLEYTELQFAKMLQFGTRYYYGTHYFQNAFRDPYIEPSELQESSFHLEATTGLILGLLKFADARPDHAKSGLFRDQALALWGGVQAFVRDHGFPYSSQRIQDLSTLLLSSTAAIWFIDVYDYLNPEGANVRASLVFDGAEEAITLHPEGVTTPVLGTDALVRLGGAQVAIHAARSGLRQVWDDLVKLFPGLKTALSIGPEYTGAVVGGVTVSAIAAWLTFEHQPWTGIARLYHTPDPQFWELKGYISPSDVLALGPIPANEAAIRDKGFSVTWIKDGLKTGSVRFEEDKLYGLLLPKLDGGLASIPFDVPSHLLRPNDMVPVYELTVDKDQEFEVFYGQHPIWQWALEQTKSMDEVGRLGFLQDIKGLIVMSGPPPSGPFKPYSVPRGKWWWVTPNIAANRAGNRFPRHHFLGRDMSSALLKTESGHLVVPFIFDGQPVRLALSTGRSVSMISEDAVKRLEEGARKRGSSFVPKKEKLTKTTVVHLNWVEMATSRFELSLLLVDDVLPPDIDGYLGADFLQNFVTEIKPNEEAVVFYPRDTTQTPDYQDLAEARLKLFSGQTKVFPKLSGKQIAGLFDTGSPFSFMNTKAANLAPSTDQLYNVRTFDEIRLGQTVFKNPSAVVVDSPTYEMFATKDSPAMIMGMNILKDRRIIVDYENGIFIGEAEAPAGTESGTLAFTEPYGAEVLSNITQTHHLVSRSRGRPIPQKPLPNVSFTLPSRVGKNGELLVPVMFQDLRLEVVLDSKAPISIVTPGLVEALTLQAQKNTPKGGLFEPWVGEFGRATTVDTAGIETSRRVVSIRGIQVGPYPMEPKAMVVDLPDVPGSGVVLGADLLGGFIIRVASDKRSVHFTAPGLPPLPKDTRSTPFIARNDKIIIDVGVPGYPTTLEAKLQITGPFNEINLGTFEQTESKQVERFPDGDPKSVTYAHLTLGEARLENVSLNVYDSPSVPPITLNMAPFKDRHVDFNYTTLTVAVGEPGSGAVGDNHGAQQPKDPVVLQSFVAPQGIPGNTAEEVLHQYHFGMTAKEQKEWSKTVTREDQRALLNAESLVVSKSYEAYRKLIGRGAPPASLKPEIFINGSKADVLPDGTVPPKLSMNPLEQAAFWSGLPEWSEQHVLNLKGHGPASQTIEQLESWRLHSRYGLGITSKLELTGTYEDGHVVSIHWKEANPSGVRIEWSDSDQLWAPGIMAGLSDHEIVKNEQSLQGTLAESYRHSATPDEWHRVREAQERVFQEQYLAYRKAIGREAPKAFVTGRVKTNQLGITIPPVPNMPTTPILQERWRFGDAGHEAFKKWEEKILNALGGRNTLPDPTTHWIEYWRPQGFNMGLATGLLWTLKLENGKKAEVVWEEEPTAVGPRVPIESVSLVSSGSQALWAPGVVAGTTDEEIVANYASLSGVLSELYRDNHSQAEFQRVREAEGRFVWKEFLVEWHKTHTEEPPSVIKPRVVKNTTPRSVSNPPNMMLYPTEQEDWAHKNLPEWSEIFLKKPAAGVFVDARRTWVKDYRPDHVQTYLGVATEMQWKAVFTDGEIVIRWSAEDPQATGATEISKPVRETGLPAKLGLVQNGSQEVDLPTSLDSYPVELRDDISEGSLHKNALRLGKNLVVLHGEFALSPRVVVPGELLASLNSGKKGLHIEQAVHVEDGPVDAFVQSLLKEASDSQLFIKIIDKFQNLAWYEENGLLATKNLPPQYMLYHGKAKLSQAQLRKKAIRHQRDIVLLYAPEVNTFYATYFPDGPRAIRGEELRRLDEDFEYIGIAAYQADSDTRSSLELVLDSVDQLSGRKISKTAGLSVTPANPLKSSNAYDQRTLVFSADKQLLSGWLFTSQQPFETDKIFELSEADSAHDMVQIKGTGGASDRFALIRASDLSRARTALAHPFSVTDYAFFVFNNPALANDAREHELRVQKAIEPHLSGESSFAVFATAYPPQKEPVYESTFSQDGRLSSGPKPAKAKFPDEQTSAEVLALRKKYADQAREEGLLHIKVRNAQAKSPRDNLTFHDGSHTSDVIQNGAKLLDAVRPHAPKTVTESYALLYKIAASFHDVIKESHHDSSTGQRVDHSGPNEVGSAKHAREFMEKANKNEIVEVYSETDIQEVENAILATVIQVDGSKISHPNLTPQSSLLARTLVIADLGNAFMNKPFGEFVEQGKKFFAELHTDIFHASPYLSDDQKKDYLATMLGWQAKENDFLTGFEHVLAEQTKFFPPDAVPGVTALFDVAKQKDDAEMTENLRSRMRNPVELAEDMGLDRMVRALTLETDIMGSIKRGQFGPDKRDADLVAHYMTQPYDEPTAFFSVADGKLTPYKAFDVPVQPKEKFYLSTRPTTTQQVLADIEGVPHIKYAVYRTHEGIEIISNPASHGPKTPGPAFEHIDGTSWQVARIKLDNPTN